MVLAHGIKLNILNYHHIFVVFLKDCVTNNTFRKWVSKKFFVIYKKADNLLGRSCLYPEVRNIRERATLEGVFRSPSLVTSSPKAVRICDTADSIVFSFLSSSVSFNVGLDV